MMKLKSICLVICSKETIVKRFQKFHCHEFCHYFLGGGNFVYNESAVLIVMVQIFDYIHR